ncbi:hypothetical protein ACFQ9X_46805 [Catenulispora yoronensis]
MRRYLAVVSLVALVGCSACGTSSRSAGSSPTRSASGAASPGAVPTAAAPTAAAPTAAPSPDPMAGICPAGAVHAEPPPAWTASAHPPVGNRWVEGVNGLAVGVLFKDPLQAGQDNKILWIMKVPRDGAPLEAVATPQNGGASVDLPETPPDAEPGEIYPSINSVPTPGCWIVQLGWGNAHDVVAVPFT